MSTWKAAATASPNVASLPKPAYLKISDKVVFLSCVTYTGDMPKGGAKTYCSVAGCGQTADAQTLCPVHYGRLRRHGDPLVQLRIRHSGTEAERFWAKVDRNGPVPAHRPELGPCWVWEAGHDRPGS